MQQARAEIGLSGKIVRALLALAFCAVFAPIARAEAPNIDAKQFLSTYCYKCHGAKTQKADRRFDTLGTDLTSLETARLWQDILDQLNLGEMPPRGARRPSTSEIQQMVDWITPRLAAAHAQDTASRTTLRRLNRVQYDRTVRHLLSLDDMLADPTENFPPDETHDGFDNIGAALVTSDFLLQNYLEAAELLVTRASSHGPQPESRRYRFQAPFCPTGNRHDGQDVPGEYQNIRKNTSDEGGHLWLAKLADGVPHAGYYTLRFKAQAIYREYPYDESLVGARKDEPLRVRIVAGSSAYGYLENRTTSDRPLGEFELPDDAPAWIETRIWLDEGYQPRLTFPNGPNRVKPLRKPLTERYPETFPEFIEKYVNPDAKRFPDGYRPAAAAKSAPKGKSKLTTAGTSRSINSRSGWSTFFREYLGPRVRVYEIELEGPHYDQWPTNSHRALFGEYAVELANAEAILRRFASRAFRRPVSDDEIKVLVEVVRERHEQGDSERDAIAAGLKAVLCSPAFLYLEEKPGPLDDYALASRLSYFLWSSMPDDELLEAAARGELTDSEALQAQARRMLADRRSDAFVEQFTSRWLELYKIGSMPPDPVRFRAYYVDNLETAMRQETRLFFRHLLDENLPIDQFLDSDFAFVNSSLARLYEIPGVRGSTFQKVSLADSRRGGLLGQASVLTASANGIDTSPVVRGIWVLENMLGTPPSPPPPDIEPLEPDIRGATTIRDQLEKHRNVETCAHCHRKIDPLGFALENFDPIGGWRDHYGRGRGDGPAVDPSGMLPDGREFKDIAELKKILSERHQQFARCLTEKMLAYSIGRPVDAADRPVVDKIVAELSGRGNGLRDLVLLIVASDAFRAN